MTLLDIVVPACNVAAYLDDCLASLAAQTLTDIEVVVVDDGSTDGTANIAAEWAERDLRFRVIRQDNHGLGHARNIGIAATSGRYLAFVDGDDVVPADAYEKMIRTLERTGSDVATGAVLRLTGSSTHRSVAHRGIFNRTRERTNAHEHRALLRDRIACNKVWRRAYWGSRRFPEGVLYEDIAVIIPAIAAAAAVDVLADVVYLWRQRQGGGDSITSDRTSLRHVQDRMAAILAASQALSGDRELKRDYEAAALEEDLVILLKWLPLVDDAWKAELVARYRELAAQFEPATLDSVAAEVRLWCHLLATDDVVPLTEAFADPGALRDVPIVVEGGRPILDHPLRRILPIPSAVLDAGQDLRLKTAITAVRQDGARLEIDGWAHLDRVAVASAGAAAIAVWLERNDGTRIDTTVARRFDPAMSSRSSRAIDLRWAAFTATVDLTELAAFDRGTWVAHVSVAAVGAVRSGRLRFSTEPGTARRWSERSIGSDLWAHPIRRDTGGFEVAVIRRGLEVVSARNTETTIELTLARHDGGASETAMVEMDAGDGGPTILLEATAGVVAVPATALMAAGATSWIVWVRRNRTGKRTRLRTTPGFASHRKHHGEWELEFHRSGPGNLHLEVSRPQPRIVSAVWETPARLRLEVVGAQRSEVVVGATAPDEEWVFDLEPGDATSLCRIEAGGVDRFETAIPLRARAWSLSVRDHGIDLALRIDDDVMARLPIETVCEQRHYALVAGDDSTAMLTVESGLAPDERGRYAQHLLQAEFQAYRGVTEPTTIVFESFGGRQFSDSPRVLHDALVAADADWTHLVVVDDHRFQPPSTARVLPKDGRDYYAALASARHIVANANLPEWFEGHPGQITLHTGHGQAYKRIGLDVRDATLAARRSLDRQRRMAAAWDFVVSPSPHMSEILRRAWEYTGALLETGYPRNDVFFDPHRDKRAEAVRRNLGLPAGKRVVLYAPTFRDDASYGGFRARLDMRLDLERAASALGPGHVLLVRQHYFVVDRLPRTPFAIDVTDYPDIQDLLLVTDVLVTDYSSVMFDFANTGRPMVFFAYDEARYASTRGAYFELAEVAPGPVVSDSDSVIAAVAAATTDAPGYAGRYEAFVSRFCPWDDGRATGRVIATVFGGGA